VADRAVFSCGVHRLEDKQHRVAVGRVEQALQFAQIMDIRGEQLFVFLFRAVEGLYICRPFFQPDLFIARNTKMLQINFHRMAPLLVTDSRHGPDCESRCLHSMQGQYPTSGGTAVRTFFLEDRAEPRKLDPTLFRALSVVIWIVRMGESMG